jgi:serine protease Do
LSNGDNFDTVSIIDYDATKDIALLKIKGFDLPHVQMGNSNSVEVGDEVIVIGAPRGFEQSVTRGIVSSGKLQYICSKSGRGCGGGSKEI